MLSATIWYIWHYTEDFDPNWQANFAPGLDLAMARLQSYTNTSWSYSFERSFYTSYAIGAGRPISYSDAIGAVRELSRGDPYFQAGYRTAELPIFIFANTGGALSVDYRSPIYGSDNMVLLENSDRRLTLIEHEIGHTFGLPDHMQPFSNPLFGSCMMGNLYQGTVALCNECLPRFVRDNYRKETYENIMGYEIRNLSFSWKEAYATWLGLSGVSPIVPPEPVVWPTNTEITVVWQFGITGNYAAPITVEFFDVVSYPVTLVPGSSGEAITIIPPKSSGTYRTELVVRAGNMVIGREPVTMPLEITSPGDPVMREQAVVTFTGDDVPDPVTTSIIPLMVMAMIVAMMMSLVGTLIKKE